MIESRISFSMVEKTVFCYKYWLENYLFQKIYPYWFPCMRQCIIFYLSSTEDFNFENGIMKKKIGNLKMRYTLGLVQI